MITLKKVTVVLALAMSQGLLAADLPTDTSETIPAPPAPLSSGILVDSYDHGLFAGVIVDPAGSRLELDVKQNVLHGRYTLATDGFAGWWSKVGESWENTQDWSGISRVGFCVWVDQPAEFILTIQDQAGNEWRATCRAEKGKSWTRLWIPVADLRGQGAGTQGSIGVVKSFYMNISNSSGSGEFAVDDLRVER